MTEARERGSKVQLERASVWARSLYDAKVSLLGDGCVVCVHFLNAEVVIPNFGGNFAFRLRRSIA